MVSPMTVAVVLGPDILERLSSQEISEQHSTATGGRRGVQECAGFTELILGPGVLPNRGETSKVERGRNIVLQDRKLGEFREGGSTVL